MNTYCLATIVNHEEITSEIWKMGTGCIRDCPDSRTGAIYYVIPTG